MQLNSVLELLKGRKTHLFLLAYILMQLFTGAGPEGDLILESNLNHDSLSSALQAGVVSALKAKWDRSTTPTLEA